MCLVFEPRFRFIKSALEERDVNVIVIGRGLFDYLFRKRLASYIRENHRSFGEYALDSYQRHPDDRRRYLADCRYIAMLLKAYLPTSTIILPKYNDDYTLEVVQAFHDTGWTTIVYDREGTVTPKRLAYVPPVVAKQAPTCDYVVTYNETHKAFFEKVSALAGMKPPSIIVMGNPASDEWFRRNGSSPALVGKARSTHRDIVFFAFGEFSYVFDTVYLKGKTEVWRELLSDIHRELADHLIEFPNDIVHYKRGPKGNRDYWAGSETLLALPNAELVPNTANSNQLILEGDVIVAFQTTALIDAMHTDRVIIYCAWGSNYDELKDDLIPFEDYARQGALVHASSPAELKRLLSMDPQDIPIDLAARKRVRELYTTNPDGLVANRFADWILDTLNPIANPSNVRR